jgi:hypothetical protein
VNETWVRCGWCVWRCCCLGRTMGMQPIRGQDTSSDVVDGIKLMRSSAVYIRELRRYDLLEEAARERLVPRAMVGGDHGRVSLVRSWVRNACQVLAHVSARPHAAPKTLIADDALASR